MALPVQASVVPGQLLGVFSGNDSVAGLYDNLGLDVTLLAKIDTPSTIETLSLSKDGLTISDFELNSDNEAIGGEWSYSKQGIANIVVLKAGPRYAVYLFTDAITDNMPNIGLWDTSELYSKGLSHISAYSTTVIPVPGAFLLFGSGILGLGFVRRKTA